MKRAVLLTGFLLVAACATSDVDGILQKNRGKTIAVAFHDLRDGRTFFRNEHEVFHAASTMKVPVMMAIFEAVSRGALSLDQPVRVRNEFSSIFDGSSYSLDPKDDSDNEMYNLVGREVPLEFLVRRMIVRSSNLATNNVIELVGAKQVMSLMHRIGANDIQVLRGVEDQKAYDHGMNNTTTAYDLMLVFRVVMASEKMIDILAAQEFNSGIPAGLPPGTRVAHKTGDITKIAHDAGIVFRPDGSAYVLVVLTRGFERLTDANKVIAQISHAVWRTKGGENVGKIGRNRHPSSEGLEGRHQVLRGHSRIQADAHGRAGGARVQERELQSSGLPVELCRNESGDGGDLGRR